MNRLLLFLHPIAMCTASSCGRSPRSAFVFIQNVADTRDREKVQLQLRKKKTLENEWNNEEENCLAKGEDCNLNDGAGPGVRVQWRKVKFLENRISPPHLQPSLVTSWRLWFSNEMLELKRRNLRYFRRLNSEKATAQCQSGSVWKFRHPRRSSKLTALLLSNASFLINEAFKLLEVPIKTPINRSCDLTSWQPLPQIDFLFTYVSIQSLTININWSECKLGAKNVAKRRSKQQHCELICNKLAFKRAIAECRVSELIELAMGN